MNIIERIAVAVMVAALLGAPSVGPAPPGIDSMLVVRRSLQIMHAVELVPDIYSGVLGTYIQICVGYCSRSKYCVPSAGWHGTRLNHDLYATCPTAQIDLERRNGTSLDYV